MVSEHPKRIRQSFQRIGGWILSIAAAITVALAVDWAKYFASPDEVLDAGDDRFEVAGMTVRCNAPVSKMLGDRNIRALTHNVSEFGQKAKSGAYFAIAGHLFQYALDSGQSFSRYSCDFSEPQYFIEFYGLTRPHQEVDGRECRQIFATRTHFHHMDDIRFTNDKVLYFRLDTCRGNDGYWEIVREREEGSAPR